jgi:hypothetical protein
LLDWIEKKSLVPGSPLSVAPTAKLTSFANFSDARHVDLISVEAQRGRLLRIIVHHVAHHFGRFGSRVRLGALRAAAGCLCAITFVAALTFFLQCHLTTLNFSMKDRLGSQCAGEHKWLSSF